MPQDMVYLARLGYRVVGVDGVRKAIEDFGKDYMDMPDRTPRAL